MAWEGPEEPESTWEPVSRVYDGATAILRQKLKALLLRINHKRGIVQRYGLHFYHAVVRKGIPNLALLVFDLIETLNFEFYFWLEISAPGSDNTLRSHSWRFIAEGECGQSMSGFDTSVLDVTVVLNYAIHVCFGFRQVACAIGGVTRGPWCA